MNVENGELNECSYQSRLLHASHLFDGTTTKHVAEIACTHVGTNTYTIHRRLSQ